MTHASPNHNGAGDLAIVGLLGYASFRVEAVREDGGTIMDVSLRDYLAGRAIEGLLSGHSIPRDLPDTHHVRRVTLEEMAIDAYAVADAMLLERSKPVENVRSLKPGGQAQMSNDARILVAADLRKKDRA